MSRMVVPGRGLCVRKERWCGMKYWWCQGVSFEVLGLGLESLSVQWDRWVVGATVGVGESSTFGIILFVGVE